VSVSVTVTQTDEQRIIERKISIQIFQVGSLLYLIFMKDIAVFCFIRYVSFVLQMVDVFGVIFNKTQRFYTLR
jgi:hypothetical protein